MYECAREGRLLYIYITFLVSFVSKSVSMWPKWKNNLDLEHPALEDFVRRQDLKQKKREDCYKRTL